MRVATPFLKQVAYGTGLLSLYHRHRNRRTLTVVMFHRVLAPTDPRFDNSPSEWTVTTSVFEGCLAFFKRHYNIVSLDDVLGAQAGGAPLPDFSLLVTFDDGYADNAEYALPILRKYGFPAVLFVFSDGIDRTRRPWQEDFYAAWMQGNVTTAELRATFQRLGGRLAVTDPDEMARDLVQRAPVLSDQDAAILFESLTRPLFVTRLPPQMVTSAQLRELQSNRVSIGAHGKTHSAIPLCAAPEEELRVPREVIAGALGTGDAASVSSMSFPHGLYTQEIVAMARREGYRLLFTSRECLVPTENGRLTQSLLGRIHISGPHIAPTGRLHSELLALLLFTGANT